MLFTFQRGEFANALIRAPPAHCGFEDTHTYALKVLAQDLLALLTRQLGKAQLQVASGNADERQGQEDEQPAKHGSDPHQNSKRQRLEYAQQPEREPSGPIAWSEEVGGRL